MNSSIESIAKKSWSEFRLADKQTIFGLLAVVGGWTPPIRTGQPVQIEINNQWVNATVIDDGLGKKRISAILNDDDTLTIQKVPVNKVRPLPSNHEWLADSAVNYLIN